RRQAMQAVDLEEFRFAGGGADHSFDQRVAWPQASMQRGEIRLRLDHDAAPAALIEPERDAARDRVSAAEVDVASLLSSGKREVEMIVLHVLGIGERPFGRSAPMGAGAKCCWCDVAIVGHRIRDHWPFIST